MAQGVQVQTQYKLLMFTMTPMPQAVKSTTGGVGVIANKEVESVEMSTIIAQFLMQSIQQCNSLELLLFTQEY